MSRRRRPPALVALTAAVAVAGGVSACSSSAQEPVRIGVLADCVGLARNLGDAMLSGAELPLIDRGARRLGAVPGDGISPATVAGRQIELVPGCTEGGEFASQIAETRRLIEREHVVAIVGGTWPGDGIALRQVAHRYPDVAFVVAVGGPREVTLVDPAPNLVRVSADMAQSAAGLASYARKDLGWQHALVVADHSETGWEGGAAFRAQFCAAGGHVTQVELPPGPPDVGAVDRPEGIDGIVVMASPFTLPGPLLAQLAGSGARRLPLLLGPGYATDAGMFAPYPTELGMLVGISPWPAPDARASYDADYASAFPEQPAGQSSIEPVIAYRDATSAVVGAIDSVGGDLDAGGAELRRALHSGTAQSVDGTITLTEGGQATVPTHLVRYRGSGDDSPPAVTEMRAGPAVDATLDGLLPPSVRPASGPAAC